MKKDQLLGLIRELSNTVGAALVTYGILSGEMMQLALGLVMCIASLFFAIANREGKDIVFTLIRKLLSAGGGVAIALGVITPDKIEALVAVVGPMLALIWSVRSNGPGISKGVSFCILLTLVLCLPSCAGLTVDLGSDPNDGEIRTPVSGIVLRDNGQGGAKAVIDSATVKRWFNLASVLIDKGEIEYAK